MVLANKYLLVESFMSQIALLDHIFAPSFGALPSRGGHLPLASRLGRCSVLSAPSTLRPVRSSGRSRHAHEGNTSLCRTPLSLAEGHLLHHQTPSPVPLGLELALRCQATTPSKQKDTGEEGPSQNKESPSQASFHH